MTSRYSDRAIELVARSPVVEMLGGIHDPLNARDGRVLAEDWFDGPGRFSDDEADFVRSSGIRVFALGELHPGREAMLEFQRSWNFFLATNARHLERIDSAAKLRGIFASDKIGVILSVQDSDHFDTGDDVEFFHGLGLRISQLTYNGTNRLGCGSFVPVDTGLTPFGADVVARMNAIGMAVDLSHCGDRTTLDAIAASTAPVLLTHASCRALVPDYARAKTDEALRKVAAGGGVIGVPMLRFMLRDREPVTIEHFLDHVDHLAHLVGIDHVGIGSDQNLVTEDDMPLEERRRRLENAPAEYRVHTDEEWRIGVEGLDHACRTFDVAEGLLRRGYSADDAAQVLGGNFVRVLCSIFGET